MSALLDILRLLAPFLIGLATTLGLDAFDMLHNGAPAPSWMEICISTLFTSAVAWAAVAWLSRVRRPLY